MYTLMKIKILYTLTTIIIAKTKIATIVIEVMIMNWKTMKQIVVIMIELITTELNEKYPTT